MAEQYPRSILFKNIANFRDLGGYQGRGGRTMAWRRLFRSAELHRMTPGDLQKLKEEIRLAAVIDLRSEQEIKQGLGLLAESGTKYHNVPFIADGGDRVGNERRYSACKTMGVFYLSLIAQRSFGEKIVEALEIIADPANHPLVFHCSAGKDRTGILAAIVLSVLGVDDADIVKDYGLSAPFIEELYQKLKSENRISEADKALPEYFWTAAVESMHLFLDTLRRDFGSATGYLKTVGAEDSLPKRLETALFV